MSLTLRYFGTLKANPVRLFEHLTPECQPIAAKSRHYSRPYQEFIRNQVCQLLRDDNRTEQLSMACPTRNR